MRASFAWVSWYSPIGLAEHDAVLGVLRGPPRRRPASRRWPGRRSAAGRSRSRPSGSRSPGPSPPSPPMRLSAGDEPVVEGDLVGVHAAVADRVDRRGPPSSRRRAPSSASCVSSKPWPSPRSLGTMNIDRPRWPASSGRGRCGRAACSTSARAPNVHQVFTPLISQPPSVAGGGDLDAGDVGAEVGLGDGDGVHDLGGGQLGQPLVLLLLGAAGESARARISGRVMSEPPAPSEPRDSSSVATTMPMYSDSPPLAVAAVLLGDRQAEGAHLGEARDDRPRGCRRCRGGCARRSA